MAKSQKLREIEELVLPPTADMHVHLRDGDMMNLVVPCIHRGGVDTVFVMPNLVPPITTVPHALRYKEQLQQLAPNVTFLMSLYLHPSITPETIEEAKAKGIAGVKSYPAGVTTNSDSGVLDYEQYYPVFAAMEKHDIVLNLHGEVPSTKSKVPWTETTTNKSRAQAGEDVSIMNAEGAFLPTLLDLHRRFPKLRIVLEHCSTAAAVEAVKACGDNVVATITAHHLFLTIDDAASDVFSFCKPVAKSPADRAALLNAVVSGSPKFFYGSDSAPHPLTAKRGGEGGLSNTAAGCFTQSYGTQLVVKALEDSEITRDGLEKFLSTFGRQFYRVPVPKRRIHLTVSGKVIPDSISGPRGFKVVNFGRGWNIRHLDWDNMRKRRLTATAEAEQQRDVPQRRKARAGSVGEQNDSEDLGEFGGPGASEEQSRRWFSKRRWLPW